MHTTQNSPRPPGSETAYRPPGFTSLTPLVCVSPAAAAIDFYGEVFGARVTSRMDGSDGSVWHAELELESGRMQVMDPSQQFNVVAADPGGDMVGYSLSVYVPDVDATVRLAVERGATVREQPADFEVTGDRFASLRDPFGVRWTVLTRTRTRTDAEVQEALDAWAGSMAEETG